MPSLEEKLKIYSLYRTRVTDEYLVINSRLTWLMVTESLLATGLLLSKEPSITLTRAVIWTAAALAGIFVATLSHVSIRAAINEIIHLKTQYRSRYSTYSEDQDLLPLVGQEKNDRRGSLMPKYLPLSVILGWLAALGYVWVDYRQATLVTHLQTLGE